MLNRLILSLSIAVGALFIGIGFVFGWPHHYDAPENGRLANVNVKRINALIDRSESDSDPIAHVRPGLFKPATPIRDKPISDKTVERIQSKLKLQCIMTINNKLAAYIKIDGVGLKQCCVGQTIHDLFTVLGIYDDRVDLSIIDHKVSLRM